MKKILLAVVVLGMAMAFASCTADVDDDITIGLEDPSLSTHDKDDEKSRPGAD